MLSASEKLKNLKSAFSENDIPWPMTKHFSKTAIWDKTGLKISIGAQSKNRRAIHFENLNPQVKFTHVFTRWELVRVAVWFLRRSI